MNPVHKLAKSAVVQRGDSALRFDDPLARPRAQRQFTSDLANRAGQAHRFASERLSSFMDSWIVFLVFIAVWFALQTWVLPKLGVAT